MKSLRIRRRQKVRDAGHRSALAAAAAANEKRIRNLGAAGRLRAILSGGTQGLC